MRIVEWIDKTERTIYMTSERWSHITTEHPEVTPYVKDFENMSRTISQ